MGSLLWGRHRHAQVHLGALARRAAQPDGTAVARRPGAHRIGEPVPVVGHRVGVEADAPVADEHVHGVLLGLDVHADLVDLGVLGRVDHGLAGGEDEGAQVVVEGAVADDHGSHVDRVGVLDLGRGRRDRRGEPARVRPTARRPYPPGP